MTRIAFALAATLSAALAAAPAHAEWPDRAVKIIAPSAAGGASDTFGRVLTQHLSEMFKERFYLENRPGAGGLIGSAAVANSDPDGYTFLVSNVGYVVIAPLASDKPGFDTMRDLAHVAYIGGPPIVFVVNPALNVKTLDEFMDYARRNGPVDYASPGRGTLGHLVAERFAEKNAIKVQHIPTRGGSAAVTDLVAGTVNFGSMTWTSALGQIRAGKLIPLAVTSERRMPDFPDVPTLKELGHTDFVEVTWFGIAAPAKTPRDIVMKMNQAINEVFARADIKERTERDGNEVKPMTPEAFTAFMANEMTKWGPLVSTLKTTQ
jgi:tripartite-type tricarboxylate transporter receptor subunit TctC